MKKILATAAVLAFAGSAFAGSFAVNGAVDTSQGEVAGGIGAGLVFEGSASYAFFGGLLNPDAIASGFAHSGAYISTPDGSSFGSPAANTAFAPGGSFSPNSFNKAWFAAVAGGTPSGAISVDGNEFQAVHIFYADAGVTGISLTTNNNGNLSLQINSALEDVNFDAPNANGYFLVTVPNTELGGQSLYVALIPAPGAAGLLGLAGLAAVRRRR